MDGDVESEISFENCDPWKYLHTDAWSSRIDAGRHFAVSLNFQSWSLVPTKLEAT